MAKIIKRVWTVRGATGRKVRHVAYGYDLRVNGRRERKWDAAWESEEAAHAELVKRQQAIQAGRVDRQPDVTLDTLAARYLVHKGHEGKRSLRDDRRILTSRLLPAFGPDLLVRRLTAEAIARYEERRLAAVSPYTVANELSVLRHLLRLGRRWGALEVVPEITLPKKPEGRQRFLDADEIARLLDACRQSRNPYLPAIVTVAINTGMRKAEILGLEWERIDLATSRITLSQTKRGKPRGVPINRAVYDALVALEPAAGRRHGPVFRRRDARAWGQVRTAFTTALRRAGIAGARFHDLRHTTASHMVMRGRSLLEVKEVLGHSDIKLTLRYAHLSPSHLLSAVAALDGLTTGARGHTNGHIAPRRTSRTDEAVAQVADSLVS